MPETRHADATDANGLPVVCHILHTLEVGGAEMLAARLARGLGDRYRFVFVCLDALGDLGRQLRADGFPVEVLGRRPGLDWRCSLRLRRLLGRERAALIHAHQYTPFLYALLARLPWRRPPVVFHEHGRHFPDYRRPKRVLANRLLLNCNDRVVAVGDAVRQALVDNEGIPAHRIEVIYNGMHLSVSEPPDIQRTTSRKALEIPADRFVIAQVARLDYLKDHATALRAMRRVIRRHPNVQLLLVGDGPLRGSIEALIRQYDLTGCVRLLGQRNDVHQLLPAADLFLLTSISEGIPLTVIEAMAAQLPVVATRVGGIPEVVLDGQTGLLAPAQDDDAVANRICRLVEDPMLRCSLGLSGQRRAAEVFDEGQMHDRYRNLYDQLLGTVSFGRDRHPSAAVSACQEAAIAN